MSDSENVSDPENAEHEALLPEHGASSSAGRVRTELVGLPRWKKIALGVAAVFMLAGLGLSLTGGSGDAGTPPSSPTAATGGGAPGSPAKANTFTAGTGSTGSSGTSSGSGSTGAEPASPWTPFLLKGGFSFFAGFCLGFALRTFFKISAAAIGLLLFVLFGLAYAEVIDVDWTAISGYYDGAVDTVKAELGGFKSFVAGSLPSVGLTGFGFFTGFKRG